MTFYHILVFSTVYLAEMSKALEKGPGPVKTFKGGDNVKEHISVIRFAIFPPCMKVVPIHR